MNEVAEIFEYLRLPRQEVKTEALRILLALSANEATVKSLTEAQISQLVDIACEDSPPVAKAACEVLVNLSGEDEVAAALESAKNLSSLLEKLQEHVCLKEERLANLLLMTLSNISRRRSAIQRLLDRDLFLYRLYLLWCQQDATDESMTYAGNVLTNLSTESSGRKWLANLQEDEWKCFERRCYRSSSRESTLGIIRNLCLDNTLIDCSPLLKPDRVLKTLGQLVYPKVASSTPHPFTQAGVLVDPQLREQNSGVEVHPEIAAVSRVFAQEFQHRKLILEALSGLLRSPLWRGSARNLGFYEVLRAWHSTEENAELKDAIGDIVHLVHYSEQELREQDERSVLTAQETTASSEG